MSAATPSRLFGPKLAVARALGRLSRRSGRGGGTTLPGRILLKAAPDAISRLSAQLTDGSAVISATNGKTTTAAMIAAILEVAGRAPVHNRAGSNMAWGVATALLEQPGTEGLFEVDEAWLPKVVADIEPGLLILGNLFRDQLDRYGELEHLADEWAAMVAEREGSIGLVLNADDPLVADLGRDAELRKRERVTYFGIEDPSQALAELQHAHDAKHCRRCGTPYDYERAFVGHLGHYTCPNCEADRPLPDVAAVDIELLAMRGSRFTARTPDGEIKVELSLPGLYNVYNALAAIAASLRLGLESEQIATGLAAMKAVFGRVETIAVNGKDISILLIKNPAGANEVLRTLRLEADAQEDAGGTAGDEGTANTGGIDLWLALNDRIADGRDVSWIWDADFELLEGKLRRVVCAGTRAPEIALRLKYAGVPTELIEVESDIAAALDLSVAAAADRLFALPTYTALLELRTLLSKRGLAKDYWR